MNPVAVSRTARQRIRAFSILVWVWGAVVLFIGGLNTFNAQAGPAQVEFEDEVVQGPDELQSPWEVAEPTVFEPDGTTYTGRVGGLIRIPLEEHDQDPYALTLVSDGYVSLHATDAEDLGQPATERSYPHGVGDVYRLGQQLLILPQDADLELWVDTDAPWEFTLQKAEVTEIRQGFADGAHTGTGTGNKTGTRYLVYRGNAASAHFSHRGAGAFLVTDQSVGSSPPHLAVSEIGDADQRASWNPATAVYFSVRTDDRYDAAWSIDIDELAADAPAYDAPTTTESTPR